MKTPKIKTVRDIIRKHAKETGAHTYRILQSDEVHYYGRMPNSPEVGWYFVSYNASDWAKDIEAENDLIAEGKARR